MIMEEEVEDIVGDVNYTDSQKSITASNVYSLDFTDCSSDKNHSSSKETYVIDCDDSDTSAQTLQSNAFQATVQTKDNAETQTAAKQSSCVVTEFTKRRNRSDRNVSLQQCSLISQEMFTQTSKTILELAQNEKRLASNAEGLNSLETQTSFLSITENKTVEYHFQLISDNAPFNPNEMLTNSIVYNTNFINQALAESLEDRSSIYQESENEIELSKKNLTEESDEKIIKFVDDSSRENIVYEKKTEYEISPCDSDMEEDSLDNVYRQETDQDISESSEIPKSIDNDIDDLYRKLSRCGDVAFHQDEKVEAEIPIVGVLTPLTEETNVRKTSVTDMSPSEKTLTKYEDTKNTSQIIKSKSTVNPMKCENQSHFKLPPINNFSCPNSPLNFLFNASNKLIKTNTLPLVSESRKERSRWKVDTNASGENPLMNIYKDTARYHSDTIELPPINHGEGLIKKDLKPSKAQISEANQDAISIRGKIRDLKMAQRRPRFVSRSPSPTSTTCSPTETKLSDAAERGCEALCGELLRRLRLNSWVQTLETLDELPNLLENFWAVVAEHRIAELIRQVSVHVDSARTQVSRVACHTLAAILKNTNYTKKPDFFEAMATLLVKTGSYCRPVRKAANVALDLVVCSVEVTHSVTAICVYGTGHKSALVRCASARLLVVCAAFAEGGRLLLRGRPPSAATARAHVLRALSHLLYDKNTESRKYAERLYAMLRPLNNFEAYYLTDVDIETASRQMKKYDRIISISKQT